MWEQMDYTENSQVYARPENCLHLFQHNQGRVTSVFPGRFIGAITKERFRKGKGVHLHVLLMNKVGKLNDKQCQNFITLFGVACWHFVLPFM